MLLFFWDGQFLGDLSQYALNLLLVATKLIDVRVLFYLILNLRLVISDGHSSVRL